MKRIHTRIQILKAFNDLLAEGSFEHITVDTIIARSGVSRSTFYRHFSDKYDVMNSNCVNLTRQLLDRREYRDWRDMYLHIFRMVADNLIYYKRAFRTSGQNAHSAFLFNYSFDFVRSCFLRKHARDELTTAERYLISHYCRGCISLLDEWISDPRRLAPEEMADIFWATMPECLRSLPLYSSTTEG